MKDDHPLEPLDVRDLELLRKFRRFYDELATGERAPTTAAQEHFVAVMKGSALPETPHELAYLRRRRILEAIKDSRSEESQSPIQSSENEWDRYEFSKCK